MRALEKIVACGGLRFLLRVERSTDGQDYPKYEELRNEIWGVPEDRLAGTRNLICENFLVRGGSLVIGAFSADGDGFPLDREHLVGFSYGFVGTLDKEIGYREAPNLRFYSQYTCVRPAFQSFGLGVLIKEFQREVVLDALGLDTILCTYDPLTGVNANRNIHHFGMEVLEYLEALKGAFGGNLNREDVPSDRFLVSWPLRRVHRPAPFDPDLYDDPSRRVIRAGVRTIPTPAGPTEVEGVIDLAADPSADRLLVQVPRDFYRMLRETAVDDPDVRRIPFDWRMATRQAFQSLFRRRYAVTDFLRAEEGRPGNFYVLERTARPANGA
jgi:predicted GNAT superfamily acetyltransferase